MKRVIAGLAVAALSMMPLAGHAAPEGCAVVAGQGMSSGTITAAGAANGIVGGGSWTVTITRIGRDEPIVISRTHAAPEVIQNVFEVGDSVSCVADEGAVVAGTVS